MLDSETLFRPCDCGGPGWEKIAFYDFSQQECPPNFSRSYDFNNVSCIVHNRYNQIYPCYGDYYSYSSSLPLPVEGRSYSSVCGRVKGHGWATAFQNTLFCNYSLEEPYVAGVSLTHGPVGRRRHIWTFAAAYADGYPYNITENCGCSNTSIKMTHTTPDFVGHEDYFWIVTDTILWEVGGMREMLMMIYGMGKDVAQAAIAVNGTTHLTSANTSTTPHLRTWKLDSSQIMIIFIIILPPCLS